MNFLFLVLTFGIDRKSAFLSVGAPEIEFSFNILSFNEVFYYQIVRLVSNPWGRVAGLLSKVGPKILP